MTENNRIPVEEASAEQLRDFAIVTLGLPAEEIDKRWGADRLRRIVRDAGWVRDTIPAESNAPASTAPPSVGEFNGVAAPEGAEWVDILIHAGTHENDETHVLLSVNGRNLRVERGVRCAFPAVFMSSLLTATPSMPIKDRDDNIVGWKQTQRYGYNIYGWHKEKPEGLPSPQVFRNGSAA